eukprot:CAMPEP_0197679958 /NCGR_PEP_ID=MMETSP1338-20131121/92504_1 /TAXON_ID=43686 ORGANISM="Pelagodinium beii, Strain RCC1491" /NCGR_SAMPLE_ID=MMETSP1338 /ASSEMBLY_ACC=CAM_ASM_000754 /LENGTH=67 /DNA_ID=CAMNT_0043261077 /DNA_START=70 /DNA_END=270 /DNA_ORIENTATION=-
MRHMNSDLMPTPSANRNGNKAVSFFTVASQGVVAQCSETGLRWLPLLAHTAFTGTLRMDVEDWCVDD